MNNAQPNTIASAYDDIPYLSQAFHHCQPNRLHALTKLKGLNPPELSHARVLEIGCSFGGNLIPHAIQYPNSQIIGIDLSEKQIAVGQQMMAELGLNNVTLIAADISKVNFENIQFDYIICHGVFSWVPEFVQDIILKVIQTYLSVNGVAFISYNTYPGWHLKDMVKELMQFGSNQNLKSYDRIEQANQLLKYTDALLNKHRPHIHSEFSRISQDIIAADKHYVAHEYFELHNIPIYFHQFNHKINQYNLAYLTDSSLPSERALRLLSSEEYKRICDYFGDNVIGCEQYYDFIFQRAFRESLITHDSNPVPKTMREYDLCHDFDDLYIKIDLKYIQPENKEAHWEAKGGFCFVSNAITDKMAKHMDNSLVPIKIKEFLSLADNDQEKQIIIFLLTNLAHQSDCHISYYPYQMAEYGDKPKINKVYQRLFDFIHRNKGVTMLSNIYGMSIYFDDFISALVPYLNGEHTIKDVVEITKGLFESGELIIAQKNESQPVDKLSDEDIEGLVYSVLNNLQAQGYFNQY